ncbi:hypothetical protein [Gilliamella sp. wkB18]|uniref:hypothetical protein n=1 Tax=Gilliamella sp. wkB18 TaxID=3120260 RepID=UPI00114784FC|nr:hypothetical protein [Gilliamella apicola]
MNTETIISDGTKKLSKKYFVFRATIAIITVIALGVLFLLSTEQRIHSMNEFLSDGYLYFLLMRLIIYGVATVFILKISRKIRSTLYYKSFLRTCFVCIVFVCLNEVMLYIRLMG